MENQKTYHIAVIVAAGSGTRMKADRPKVFLDLAGKPVLARTVGAFEKCPWIDGIIVVAAEECLDEAEALIRESGAAKVLAVVPGGAARADSVYAGLRAAGPISGAGRTYVYIHDGARPFVTQEVLDRVREGVLAHGACVCGMPVKDTIRQISSSRKEEDSGLEILGGRPDRSMLRQIQTPQAFDISLVTEAYEAYMNAIRKQEEAGEGECLPAATDDAGVVEMMTDHSVCLAEGSYRNIKLTTPEDMIVGETFCAQQ